MQNEIPAGAKVKVNGQEGEVLAHMDGVVHVSIDGEAVSVLPEQVQPIDATAAQTYPTNDESTATAEAGDSAVGS